MADEAPTTAPTPEPQVATIATKGGRPHMDVKVYAPFQVYFEGEAYSVTAENETGPFDILPRHKNFLCMLVPCVLVIDSPAGVKKIKIHRALMHVKSERVVVFMDV